MGDMGSSSSSSPPSYFSRLSDKIISRGGRSNGANSNRTEYLAFDIDPTEPTIILLITWSVILGWYLMRKIIQYRHRKALQTDTDTQDQDYTGRSGVRDGVGGDDAPLHMATRPGVVTRRGGARLPLGITTGSDREQARLCEILYDVYGGEAPEEGINTKDAQACGLTPAEIRRRFQLIREARATAKKKTAKAAAQIAAKSQSPLSPARRRPSPSSASTTTVRAAAPSSSSAGKSASKRRPTIMSKAPPSPKSPKITPVKRGASPSRSRESPKSTTPSAKRPTRSGGGGSAATAAAAITTPSRVSTRKGRAWGSATKGMSSPSSPKRSTPAKRGASSGSSALAQARREAQAQADSVAAARARTLREGKRAKS